ncbi:MAG: hypothetical protein ACO3FH_04785 [Steroidobacteraceae bacterium]
MVRSRHITSRVVWWCCAVLLATQLFGIHAHRTDAHSTHGHGHFEWHFAHSGLYALDAAVDTIDLSGHGDSNADGLKSFVMKLLGTLVIALPSVWLLLSVSPSKALRPSFQPRRIVERPPRYAIKPPTQAPPLR